jgi:hypothetical protein
MQFSFEMKREIEYQEVKPIDRVNFSRFR